VTISRSTNQQELSVDDIPDGAPLLICSGPAVANSHIIDKQRGRESFMLSRRLYNGVNNHKNVESKVIVSYPNSHHRYDLIKSNLQKTILSVAGRLKIRTKKMLHIMASEIEWSYVNTNSESSNISEEKSKLKKEFDDNLDSIEEKYSNMSSDNLRKNKNLKPVPSVSSSKDRTAHTEKSNTFADAINEVKGDEHITEESENTGEPYENTLENSEIAIDEEQPPVVEKSERASRAKKRRIVRERSNRKGTCKDNN